MNRRRSSALAIPATSILLAAALVSFALPGCGGAGPVEVARPDPRTAPGTLMRFAPDPRVLVYASNDWGFTTNTFLLEGPSGLVALDTQFLPSAAAEAIAKAEALTGKSVVAAVVLHANPDKFN